MKSRPILVVALLAVLACTGNAYAQKGTVSLVAVPPNPTPGLPFDVFVYLDTGPCLVTTYSFNVFWDPAKVTYVSLIPGTSPLGPPFVVNPLASLVTFNDIDVIGVGPDPMMHLVTIRFTANVGCLGDPGITGVVDSLSDQTFLTMGDPTPRPMVPPVVSCPLPPPEVLCGDCDGSGVVNILDAAIAARAGVGLAEILPQNVGLCDVAAEIEVDVVTALDALEIARYVAGLIPSLSCSFVPSCLILSPIGGSELADVNIDFDSVDPDASTLDVTFDFSTDGGSTFTLASIAAASAFPYDMNPAIGAPPGPAQRFVWDSVTDITGWAEVIFRVTVNDGMNTTACVQPFLVDNGFNTPVEIPYVDPVAGGHIVVATPGTDEFSVDTAPVFPFRHWVTPAISAYSANVGYSSNGALRLNIGATAAAQPPLWNFVSPEPTIHVHGADGYTGTMYADFFNPTMAIYTWDAMDYGPVGAPGGWGAQLILLPNGNFQIRQVQASSDAARTITIGYSDGLATDNSKPGSTGLDWDGIPMGVTANLGHVDIGSSEPGGMATGRVIYFEFHPVDGYHVTRLQ